MTAPAIATDAAVLEDLLALRRDHRLPGWLHWHGCTRERLIQLRMAEPAHLEAWRAAMASSAEVVAEPFPAQGVDFYHADVTDWRDGWTFYLACRVDVVPGSTAGLLAEVAG